MPRMKGACTCGSAVKKIVAFVRWREKAAACADICIY